MSSSHAPWLALHAAALCALAAFDAVAVTRGDEAIDARVHAAALCALAALAAVLLHVAAAAEERECTATRRRHACTAVRNAREAAFEALAGDVMLALAASAALAHPRYVAPAHVVSFEAVIGFLALLTCAHNSVPFEQPRWR